MRECFVIMPIGSGDLYETYRNRYKNIIEPAVETVLDEQGMQLFRSVRADLVAKSGSITRDLLGRLYRSDVVIADLTDLNPNVFYELGVRHALRSGTILVALKGTRPPFDVGDLRVVWYEDRVGGEKSAIPQIQDMLRSAAADSYEQDSPILLAIPELSQPHAAQEHEARIAALQHERDILKAQLEISEKTSLTNQTMLETMRDLVDKLKGQLSEPRRREAETEIELVQQIKSATPQVIKAPHLKGVSVESSSIFVLMPFQSALDPVYQIIEDQARQIGLNVYRADTINAAGPIIDQIFESIAKAGLVIADLTGRNPNVLYELGLANAMGKETLLLAQQIEDVPFDIRHQRVLLYAPSLLGAQEFARKLSSAFDSYRKSHIGEHLNKATSG